MPKVAIIWQIKFVCYGNNVYLCKMKMIVKMRYKILIICVMMVFVGCTGSPKADQWPEWLIQADRDYKLAQGYDGKWQVRLAEMYYHKAYDALKETIEDGLFPPSDDQSYSWFLYGDAGYRYAVMRYLLSGVYNVEVGDRPACKLIVL